METTTLKTIVGIIPTAVVLTYTYLGSQSAILPPQKEHAMNVTAGIKTGYEHNPYYTVLEDREVMREQVETIHGFVSNLLENMQDLEPQYSQLVDEHFWELA